LGFKGIAGEAPAAFEAAAVAFEASYGDESAAASIVVFAPKPAG